MYPICVYKNLIVLGISNGESTDGPPGDTRTFDARTGAKLWEFKTTPQPGEPGHETWLDAGRAATGCPLGRERLPPLKIRELSQLGTRQYRPPSTALKRAYLP
jgi:hypothetical protein